MSRIAYALTTVIAVAAAAVVVTRTAEPKNDWGVPMPANPPVLSVMPGPANLPAPLVLTANRPCKIARFGQSPWDKHNAQGAEWAAASIIAFERMGLPQDAAKQALEAIQAGRTTDTVAMGNTGGVAMHSRQTYAPVFATTGIPKGQRVVCLEASTAFRDPAQVEHGELYVIGPYHIWCPLICRNCGRVYPAPMAGPVLEKMPAPESGFGVVPEVKPGQTWAPGRVNTVPEPSSLWLVLIGIGAMFAAHFKATKKEIK